MVTKYLVNTGEDGPVYKKIDEFFEEVKNSIGDRDGPSFFEIRRKTLCRDEDQGATDDYVHFLLYKEQPVASVLEVRDDRNWIRFTFFKNLEDIT